MNFEFIRKLLKNVPEEQVNDAVTALMNANLEVYMKVRGDSYKTMADSDECKDGDIYVSAADLEAAKVIVEGLGLQEFICSAKESVVVKSELQKAEEEFIRKNKRQQILCLIIMAAVVVYWVVQTLIR